MSGTIVLGYDASPGSRSALEVAVALARQFGDRLLIAFGAAPPGTMGEEWREHHRALEELGRRATAEAAERAGDAGVEVEVALVPERAALALTRLAEERDARYIVVGSYGETPIRGAILGSTPHKLLHTATRPVVVVPAALRRDHEPAGAEPAAR